MSDRIAFTDKSITAIAPRDERFIVWDGSRPGLGLRVTPNGTKTYVLAYRFDGRPRMHTLGTTKGMPLREASAAYHAAMERIDRAKEVRSRGETPGPELDPAGTKRASRRAMLTAETVADVWKAYAAKKRPTWRASTAREYDRMWDRYLQDLGPRRARDVRPKDVRAVLDDVAETGPVMANRLRTFLSAIFNFAVDKFVIETSPVAPVRMLTKEAPRERAMTDEAELRGFLTAMKAPTWDACARDALLMTLITGCRPGEAMQMRWGDVDEDLGVWTLPAKFVKTGLEHVVPLSPIALEVIAARKAAGVRGAWVFHDAGGENRLPRTALHYALTKHATALEANGVATIKPHDLRRTCRSWLAKLRVPQEIAERVLGHVPRNVMVKTYDRHDYLEEKRAALELWSATLTAMRAGDNVVPLKSKSAA